MTQKIRFEMRIGGQIVNVFNGICINQGFLKRNINLFIYFKQKKFNMGNQVLTKSLEVLRTKSDHCYDYYCLSTPKKLGQTLELCCRKAWYLHDHACLQQLLKQRKVGLSFFLPSNSCGYALIGRIYWIPEVQLQTVWEKQFLFFILYS